MQKPDILSITKSFVPRSQSWLYDQIAHLKRHHVHVLTQERFNADEYSHSPVSLLPSGRSFLSRLKRVPYRMFGMLPPVFTRRARERIAALLADGGFRLVQAHFGWVGIDTAETVEEHGLPFVIWIYGADVFHEAQARRFPKHISRKHTYCCTSHALKTRLEQLGCPADRVHVIYPGVRIPAELPERTGSDRVRIISVGRLVPFKDPMALLRIARMLRDRGCPICWQHLGRGPLRAKMETGIRRYGLAGNFTLRGAVPHEEVLAAMRDSDLMVHAAVVQPDGRRESFGVVLAEAAAAGLPIVSAAVGGIPEIIRDGTTGFLVQENDIEGMAAKAQLLASEPEMRRRLGHAAHRHAQETFELAHQVEKLDSFYDGMLA